MWWAFTEKQIFSHSSVKEVLSVSFIQPTIYFIIKCSSSLLNLVWISKSIPLVWISSNHLVVAWTVQHWSPWWRRRSRREDDEMEVFLTWLTSWGRRGGCGRGTRWQAMSVCALCAVTRAHRRWSRLIVVLLACDRQSTVKYLILIISSTERLNVYNASYNKTCFAAVPQQWHLDIRLGHN